MQKPDIILTFNDVKDLTLRLLRMLQAGGTRYDVIFGIARGGMMEALLISQYYEDSLALTCHSKRYGKKVRKSMALPTIIGLPPMELMTGKRVLIVDEVWDEGHSIIGVKQAVQKAEPHLIHTAVLHFKPGNNEYKGSRPDFYVEEVDTWVEYPWETFANEVADPTRSE